jgi:ubiquinone/menaquinone biosynthesis C-methylase UbiE
VSELRHLFNNVADAYERARPQYATEAVDWIARRFPFGRVLDLGAGTGKLTRQLVPLATSVVAVEPGDEMRRVFAAVLPDVELHAGSAESIPLPDASVDAITVAQAFHWFELETALAEMHRVLRPGGGFALLWNEWDEADPVVGALNAVVERLRTTPARDEERYRELHATTLFTNFEEPEFRHSDRVDVDTVLERVSSISAVINARPEARAAALDEVRSIVGDGTIDFKLITSVIAADRV